MEFTHTKPPIETELPKLVRDNIPAIIASDGRDPKFRVAAEDHEFLTFILKKVVEEAVEVQNHENPDELVKELADLKELTLALMKLTDITEEQIEAIRVAKAEKNGAFNKRYILETI